MPQVKGGPSFGKSYAGGNSARVAYSQGANQGLQGFALRQVCTLAAKGGEFNSHPLPTRRVCHAEIKRQICRITCGEWCADEKKGVRFMDTLVAEMTSSIWRPPPVMAAGAIRQM